MVAGIQKQFEIVLQCFCMMLFRLSILLMVPMVASAQPVPLSSLQGMNVNKVKAEPVMYKGKQALRVTDSVADAQAANEDRLVVLTATDFKDGVIEVELAGEPGVGNVAGARGFTGIAFHVAADLSKFECFYLRPTNGRADDQVRRNHSLQYISFPGFPWQKLRKEFPEMYESYADLVPGEWTKVRIEVSGVKAKLFVNGVSQSSLLVNDLKHGEARGAIGLWIGPGTMAHFANLKITK